MGPRSARSRGAEGQVVPQQWLVHTTAPGVHADDRRRLDVVIYGATTNGTALCCDATQVSPLTCTGQPQPCTADLDGAALRTAERRKAATYPELRSEGRRDSSCSAVRLADASTATRTACSGTSFGCARARRRHCELLQLQGGHDDGGAYSPSPYSKRSRAQPSAGRGRYRRMQPARQAAPRSTASSTWQRPRGRAACHCA